MIIKKTLKSFSGFTLIELLLVMAIIGGLASIVVLSFPAATARARDTQRKSDLYQFRVALETYANSHEGFYPTDDGPLADACATMGITGSCPDDPKEGEDKCEGNTCSYKYQGNTSGTSFVVFAPLEKPSYGSNWNECLSGESGESLADPFDAECPEILTEDPDITPTPTDIPPDVTPTPVEEPVCTDTDGGYNPDVYGVVEITEGEVITCSAPDACKSDSDLVEYSCETGCEAGVNVICEFGCVDGACLPEPPPAESNYLSVHGRSCDETCSKLGLTCSGFGLDIKAGDEKVAYKPADFEGLNCNIVQTFNKFPCAVSFNSEKVMCAYGKEAHTAAWTYCRCF